MRELMLIQCNTKKKQGFTLIEVLVSIIILMVGLLGMFQSVNIAMEKTIENQLRQSAVAEAESELSAIKGLPFSKIEVSPTTFRQFTSPMVPIGSVFKNISVQRQVTNLSTDTTEIKTKQISIRVWWRHRGKVYEHQTASGVGSIDSASGN